MATTRILLVEDDAPLADMIAGYLRQHGFEVLVEGRGDAACARIPAERPDLVVLDVGLPGVDGLAVCRYVRPLWSGKLLMLTARGEEHDEVAGLELGADDYLAKPVRPRLLLARLRALLRRPTPPGPAPPGPLRVGDLVLEPGMRVATVCGAVLELTSGEFDILWQLAVRAGEVVGREVLYRVLMETQYDPVDRSVDLRVSRLRHKLVAHSGPPDRIKTIRGVGYLYAARE